ncbi:hypothetical protein AGDE_13497 [Angomonas deanei]|nr:hypothetical protein AGDE_13497 [Angomonas deanei]|eukprot:EPY22230.1 hypothetical protein AGDE_13497 [Angomonas deanei]
MKNEVQKLFEYFTGVSNRRLALNLPPFADNSFEGCVDGLRSLIDFIAEKFEGVPGSEDVNRMKHSLNVAHTSASKKAGEMEELYHCFKHYIGDVTDPSVLMDGGQLSSSVMKSVGEKLFHTMERLSQSVVFLGHTSPDLHSLAPLAESVLDAASLNKEKFILLQPLLKSLAAKYNEELPPLSSATPGQVSDFVERIMAKSAAQSDRPLAREILSRVLGEITDAVHQYGGFLHMEPSSLLSLSHNERDQMDIEAEAVRGAVEDLLQNMQQRISSLTMEWQAANDQYNRLLQVQNQAEDVVLELRQRVQVKLQEDHVVEENLSKLYTNIEHQARELAMKYRADQESILKQFSDIKTAIHLAVKPGKRSASRRLPSHK